MESMSDAIYKNSGSNEPKLGLNLLINFENIQFIYYIYLNKKLIYSNKFKI